MQRVTNLIGKTVCYVDKDKKVVEIVHKGYTTIITFTADGKVEVVNK